MDPESAERYDRQIRLWGQHGQNKCSRSRVCLIGCNSLGMEVIRGLCLAGIGSFTILDSHKLLPEDVGCCFIPQITSIGKSRAETAKAMLLDINDDSNVDIYSLETYLPHVTTTTTTNTSTMTTNLDDSRDQDNDCDTELTSRDSEFWRQFSCIIISGVLYTSQIQRLSRICWSLGVPLISCKSMGFYAIMRHQIKEHLVLDTHPEWKPKSHDPTKADTAMIKGTKPLFEEYDLSNIRQDEGEDDHVTIYICMTALDLFFSTYGRLPGCRDEQVEADISKLKDCVKLMVGKSCNQLKTLDQCLYELCRYGGAELHATSAFFGGCIAQEVIKLVTNQYLPVDDTLIYNAMSATTRALKLGDVLSSPQA